MSSAHSQGFATPRCKWEGGAFLPALPQHLTDNRKEPCFAEAVFVTIICYASLFIAQISSGHLQERRGFLSFWYHV